MKLNRAVSSVLALMLLVICLSPAAYAEGIEGTPVSITYRIEPDPVYGSPTVINPPEAITGVVGQEFVLAENLKTDSILGTVPGSNEIYIGEWSFSGWTIPEYVYSRQVVSDPDETYSQEYAALITEKETKTLCKTSFDAEMTGSWSFAPKEKLVVPNVIESSDSMPLSGSYDALAKFWPEREAELNKVYATGLFPESIIKYMDENIKEIPLKSKEFASVELSDGERAEFMSAVLDVYKGLTGETEISTEARAGIESLLLQDESGNAGKDVAFVVYCGEKAGLLSGKSKSLIQTADINQLYDFLINDTCADVITVEDLMQIYQAEDGETVTGIEFDEYSVDFAHEEGWYDVENSKNSVRPGDLIVFKDEMENPVTVGIIDSVEGRSITYVLCVNNGTPAEYTLNKDDLERIGRTGAKAEIIGLRSCDASRITYEFLVNELKLPESSALGVMGNLYYESRFSTTALGDGNTSFGLCQWHNDRFLNLVIFCMKNNYNIASLEGQLKYLAYELQGNYAGLLKELMGCGINQSWTREAAYRFCRVFEQPADVEMNCALRGTMAGGAIWESFSGLFLSTAQLQNMKLAELVEVVPEQQSEYVFYTVKEGDTLASICRGFGFDYANHRREVTALNNIRNENMLYVGQILIFPRTMLQNYQNG